MSDRPRVLIGGVGYRWMRDASFGLVAIDEMARQALPAEVEVADLGYGAIYVALDLQQADPRYDRLILLAGVERGREPGRLYRYGWGPEIGGRIPEELLRLTPDHRNMTPEEIQARIREAGAGVIDLDHLLVIAHHFGALPEEVTLVELEPLETEAGEELSRPVAALLPEAIELVRREALAPRRFVERV